MTSPDLMLQKRLIEQSGKKPVRKPAQRPPQEPKGWEVDKLTHDEFWTRVYDIDDAREKGGSDLRKALSRYNLQSVEQFRWARDRYVAHHLKSPEFKKAMIRVRAFARR